MHGLVIHGGAGVALAALKDGRREHFEASLARILDEGFAVLERGGTSLDAVTHAVRLLEDDPLFNAGRGSGLTRDGTVEMDASVMSGRDLRAGAVTCVMHVRNPVELARRVMEKTSHVLLAGPGAEELALEEGLALVPNEYFRTDERRRQLENVQRGEPQVIARAKGTVGAVALDRHGDLAAATSTGGLANKRPGRVGDTPIVGAGTYAKNGVCAVSATGEGELLMRAVAGYHIAASVEYRGLPLREAVRDLVHRVLPELGGLGGVIAIDAQGTMVTDTNTQGMFRGERDASGRRAIAVEP